MMRGLPSHGQVHPQPSQSKSFAQCGSWIPPQAPVRRPSVWLNEINFPLGRGDYCGSRKPP